MRVILFRGKRADTGQWIYGAYSEHEGDAFIEVPEYTTSGELNCYIGHKVDPETVGQFTGLFDDEGSKIFEGDLLDGWQYPFYRYEEGAHNYFAEIVWFEENCAFGIVTHKYPSAKVSGISAGNADYIEGFDSDLWRVVGNVYDNSELLEGLNDG